MTQTRFAATLVFLDAIENRREEWEKLGRDALESNPFYLPASLIAAERHLHPHEKIRFLIIEDRLAENTLCGLLPLETPHWRDGGPLLRAISLYRNAYTALATPLIRAEGAKEIFSATIQALGQHRLRLILPQIPARRAFARLMKDMASEQGLPLVVVDRRERPAVETRLSSDDYRLRMWRKDTRGAQRRRLARLAKDHGTLVFQSVRGNTPAGMQALDAFLKLEASGWKGGKGTALGCHAATTAFARGAYGDGSAELDVLSVGDRPIAISINLVSQGVAYSIKAAYDETFACYGAGTLLDAAMIDRAAAGGSLTRLDSCAPVGHAIGRTWREREQVARYLLGLRPEVGLGASAEILRRTAPYNLWRGFDALIAEPSLRQG